MGRPVITGRPKSMHLVLCSVLVFVSTVPLSFTLAEHLDLYSDLADDTIVERIQRVLKQWRQNQLRIINDAPDQEIIPDLPEFTFHFPEDLNRNYQNDYFAVPPSDPRFYEPDPDLLATETKRLDENDNTIQDNEVETPTTSEENSWSEEVSSEANEPKIEKVEDVSYVFKKFLAKDDQDVFLVAIIAGCGAAAAAGVIALSIGWYKLHTNSKAAADIEYPAYGVTGPNKEITPTGDRRLAQSAQMYHYQHQKQQIIAMESNRANNERRGSVGSEGDSEEENEEGDYTVYECPGLAATGELEVKNPLFLDDPTPAAGNHVNGEPHSPAEKKQ